MNPSDLGLPAKFVKWRTGQDDAIIDAGVSLVSGRRFYVSSQPTGAGKSVFNFGVLRLIESKRTLILTATKALQQQYVHEGGEMGLVEIKGQNNYPCLAVQRPTGVPGVGELHGMAPENARCDDGPCHAGVECALKQKGCYYYDQVAKARSAPIVVTNYDYWMYSNKFGDKPIGDFDLLILDEAHLAPDKLAEFVSIYLGREEVDGLLGCSLPPMDAGLDYWSEWAGVHLAQAEHELEELKKGRGHVRTIRELRNLASKLEDLSKAREWKRGNPSAPQAWMPGASTDWVAEESDGGATFSPVWAHGYAETFLFAEIPRIVFTSATILPKTLSYLGLTPEDFEWSERPSTFPVARRPVYIVEGGVKVSGRMSRGEELVWMNKIDLILSTRLDRKAIIHAVSYDRARYIYENSRYRKHMVIHSSRDTAQQVDRFRKMPAPAILVSPTVREGWDFPYDQCELQIIAKIPFVDMRPAVVKARQKGDKLYTNYLAIMALIQSCGRGMRAADDFCETFIVDDNIRWLMQSMRALLPKWFKTAIKRVQSVPPPPPKLRRVA